MSDEGQNAPYEVGYRRPPADKRFKKGQSGNPGGRPKKLESWKDLAVEELHETIVIIEGGKRRRITKQRAIVKKGVNKALTDSDYKPLEKFGVFAEQEAAVGSEFTPLRATLIFENEVLGVYENGERIA